MENTNIAIIGASAAGLAAALTLKMKSPETKVVLFRKVSRTPVPCGIPYIYGTLKEVAKDLIPDDPFTSMGLDIRIAEVTAIDTKNHELTFNGKEKLKYDKLLLTTGSIPIIPPIEGSDLENVFAIKKEPEHLELINQRVKDAKDIVVIGGGFIGVEMAEQVAKLKGDNANITIVEMLPHCLLVALEEEFCIRAEEELKKLNINIKTNSQVTKIEGNGKVEKVILASGESIAADVVIMGVGAAPNISLAEKAGIPCDKRGGIEVDEYMKTKVEDIYAAGDCASKFSFVTKKPCGIRLASVAAYEGVIAANNMLGENIKNRGALGAFATKIGDVSIAAAGLTQRACETENIEYVKGEFVAPDKHPATLPNTFMDMKAILLFNKKDKKIIGGHVLGGDTAAEMVNIISTAIQAGLTVEDIYFMQVATHPLLTGSPIAYHVLRAAGDAFFKFKNL